MGAMGAPGCLAYVFRHGMRAEHAIGDYEDWYEARGEAGDSHSEDAFR